MTNSEMMGDPSRDVENLGEMPDADSVGTAGSEDCGDMLRMWVKFREKDGRKVIDKASFQTFGCQTALAVAAAAARMIRGKTAEEALQMRGEDLSAPLGPLPPMKIHCAQLVESALRDALAGRISPSKSLLPAAPHKAQGNLADAFNASTPRKIIFLPKTPSS
jgi:nitrogen fixation NifU-like protein